MAVRAAAERADLEAIVELVSQEFWRQPQCVDACAVFHGVAGRVGIRVRPRPTSVIAQSEQATLVIGEAAKQIARDVGMDPDSLPTPGGTWGNEFDRAGHMVITSSTDGGRFYDPTFSQFWKPGSGFPLGYLSDRETRVQRADPVIDVEVDGAKVRYMIDDSNRGWADMFAASQRYQRPRIEALAAEVVRRRA